MMSSWGRSPLWAMNTTVSMWASLYSRGLLRMYSGEPMKPPRVYGLAVLRRQRLELPVAVVVAVVALAGGRKDNFGRRRVSVLIQEIVLYLKNVVEAQVIGKFYLLHGLHYHILPVPRVPLAGVQGLGTMQLEQWAEFHMSLLLPIYLYHFYHFEAAIGFPETD